MVSWVNVFLAQFIMLHLLMELVGHSVLEGNRVPQLLFATLFRSAGLFDVNLGAKFSAGVTVKPDVANGCPADSVWVGQFLYLSHK